MSAEPVMTPEDLALRAHRAALDAMANTIRLLGQPRVGRLLEMWSGPEQAALAQVREQLRTAVDLTVRAIALQAATLSAPDANHERARRALESAHASLAAAARGQEGRA